MSILDRFRLDNKVAIVTGGAGLYGRQIARALAEAGATTILASRDLARQRDFAQTLTRDGSKADAFRLDQGSEESILQLRDDVINRYERVHVLVNNAVARPMKDWTGAASEFAASMAVNATGLFLMTRAWGAHMAEHGGGSIINVGSIQGMIGPDFTLYEDLTWSTPPDYFFHKGGLLQLTRFAASKLGPRGERVNAVSPGGFLAGQQETSFSATPPARSSGGWQAMTTWAGRSFSSPPTPRATSPARTSSLTVGIPRNSARGVRR
jgi:NAD(P)-dependent dehydrogenase (short-subunit alcohol dehydrogenase family)